MPIAALMVGGRHLVELAQLAVVPSLALWPPLRRRPPRRGHGALAFFDPGVSGWRRERTALRTAFPPVEVVERDGLRQRLADASAYTAVAISAHGADLRPGDNGEAPRPGLGHALHLGDGDLLTAAQLLTCRLPDAFITPSCWSGRLSVRTATDPLGLPTAALLAGARWVLAGTVDIGGTSTAEPATDVLSAVERGYDAGGGAPAGPDRLPAAAAVVRTPGHLGGPDDHRGRLHPLAAGRRVMFRRRAAGRALRAGEDAYFAGDLDAAAQAIGHALDLWTALAPGSDQVASCLNSLGRVHQDRESWTGPGTCSAGRYGWRPSARASRRRRRRPATR